MTDPMEANEYPDRGDGRSVKVPPRCERFLKTGCEDVTTVYLYDGKPHRFCSPCHRAYQRMKLEQLAGAQTVTR